MLSKTMVIALLSVVVYVFLLFFLAFLNWNVFGPVAVPIFFVITLLPVAFVLFSLFYWFIALHYVRKNEMLYPELTARFHKILFPLLLFFYRNQHRPESIEFDYIFVKKLNRLYLNKFTWIAFILLVVASMVGFILRAFFNSLLQFKFPIYGTISFHSSYFEVISVLWILLALVIIAQNAIYHHRILDNRFE